MAHITDLMNMLVAKNIIIQNLRTIWKETYRCAKQYIRATDFYLLSVKAVRFNVIIGFSIGSPVHEKDVVYGLNTVSKKYFKKQCFGLFL